MNIHEKLLQIQTSLTAPKNLKNDFGGYMYRSCESILEALKPLLKEHGLTITITDDLQNIGDTAYIKSTVDLSDGKEHISASAFAREAVAKKGMDVAQITGATSSYARKYALNGLFCIDDNKDPDATNKHDGADETHFITTEQRDDLIKLIEEAGLSTPTVCEAYKISSIAEMPANKFENAKKRLLASIKKRSEGNATANS